MALIDGYVRALFEQSADAIGIALGHRVTIITKGERKPLSGGPIDEAGLEMILNELVPQSQRPTLEQAGNLDVRHTTTHGHVNVNVKRIGTSLRLMIARVGTPMPRSTEGAPVRSTEGAPVASSPPSAPAAKRSPAPSTAGGEPAIDALFRTLVQKGGSDLYVCTGKKAMIRKDGDLISIGSSELSEDEVERLLYSCAPQERIDEFLARNDADFAYEIKGLARFRGNLFRDRRGIGGIFRQIPVEILTAEKLGIPQAILDLCNLSKGLVLVTGPTGSGKSTTLAAMIDYINRTRAAHIITIEDPIEFVHPDKRCVINQREVGNHTEGFKRALRAALREDPDIVLVGEMRDLETVAIAIETAETGHLVFGTLHTNTAASTVDRIIDQFPAEQQQQIRTMLADALKGVISQTLCKRKSGGRVAALEILLCPHSVSNLIREGKTYQIHSTMQTSRGAGMVTLNDALMELVEQKHVAPEEAWARAIDKTDFKSKLTRANIFVQGM